MRSLLFGALIIFNIIHVMIGMKAPKQIQMISINPFSPTMTGTATTMEPSSSFLNHGIEDSSYFVLTQNKEGKPHLEQVSSKVQASTRMQGMPSASPPPFMPRGDSERLEEYRPERDVMIGGEVITDHSIVRSSPIHVHPAIPSRSQKPQRTPPPTQTVTPLRPAPKKIVPGNGPYHVYHSTTSSPSQQNVVDEVKKHLNEHNEQSISFYYRLHELVSSTLGIILLSLFGLIALFTIVGISFALFKCAFKNKGNKRLQKREEPLTRNLIVDEINNTESHDDNNPYAFQYQTM
mmetsp:Transcript_2026/g.2913  ORF Transcript_2026/g.2913 Transcript_2026/m.2913 type:complete len:292 (-) Transcript_2026:93-968(-)